MPPNTFQENYQQIFPWVESSLRNRNEAFCKLCKIYINLSNMGIQTLVLHETRDRRHQMQALANEN